MDVLLFFLRRRLSAFDTRLRGMLVWSEREAADILALTLAGCMTVLCLDGGFVDFVLFLFLFVLEVFCFLLRG